jgi:hypothetical protein
MIAVRHSVEVYNISLSYSAKKLDKKRQESMEGGLQIPMKEKKKRHKEKPVSEKIREPKKHKHRRPTISPKTREIGPKIIKMSNHHVGKQEEGEIQLSNVPLQIQGSTSINDQMLVKEKSPTLVYSPSQAEKDSVVERTFERKEIPKTNSNLPTDIPSDFLEQDTPVTENLILNETEEIFSLSTDSPITIVFNGITIKVDFRCLKISTNELTADEVLHLLKKCLNNG